MSADSAATNATRSSEDSETQDPAAPAESGAGKEQESTGQKRHRPEDEAGDDSATKCARKDPAPPAATDWSPSKAAAIQILHDNIRRFNCSSMQEVWRTGDLGNWIEALELGKKHGDPESKELAERALYRIELLKQFFARDDDVKPLFAVW